MAQRPVETDIICKLIIHRPAANAAPKYFHFLKSNSFPYFKSILEAETGPRQQVFWFIDLENDEILVSNEEEYDIFLLWVEEMRETGKGLKVKVKVCVP
jgi:hypothetical protein